jgi:hypothetical protein
VEVKRMESFSVVDSYTFPQFYKATEKDPDDIILLESDNKYELDD